MLKILKIYKDIFKSLNKENSSKILKKNIKLRRSLFAKRNIKKKEKLTLNNTISLRPSIGIKSEYIYKVLGKILNINLKKNDPIFFKNLKR